LSALLPQIPLHVPVSLMVADWIEGYSLALFNYNSLAAGQARALRDGDQIVQHLRNALEAFPDAQRRRVKLVRWQEMVSEDPSYHEETAALEVYLRSDEGHQARRILEDMAAQFVQARKGQRTLKEERIKYAEQYLLSELLSLMRGLRGTDYRNQRCEYLVVYHPILAMQHDAETVAIERFQQIFQYILDSRALGPYFESKPLSCIHDLELEPQADGTFTTRLRPWNPCTLDPAATG
jgi:hypothetical protein